MSKKLCEKDVLKKLQISDFQHMTEDQLVRFTSLLPEMEPSVAKRALAQFPQFEQVSRCMIEKYEEYINKGLESNDESVKAFYGACNTILDALRKELDKESTSTEDRDFIINKMVELAKMMGEKDSENKRFISGVLDKVGWIVGGMAIIALAVLGGRYVASGKDDPLRGYLDGEYEVDLDGPDNLLVDLDSDGPCVDID